MYLYFLANILPIEKFNANDTMAILIALPNIFGKMSNGGTCGAGKLNFFDKYFSLIKTKKI